MKGGAVCMICICTMCMVCMIEDSYMLCLSPKLTYFITLDKYLTSPLSARPQGLQPAQHTQYRYVLEVPIKKQLLFILRSMDG